MIERAINWWMSAPVDGKAAVLLFVVPQIVMAVVVWQMPPHH